MKRFSPVAGIQWVETSFKCSGSVGRYVSVPLPGFSGLRLLWSPLVAVLLSFSPVAGIQWVETISTETHDPLSDPCFSPVAGIQWVETSPLLSRCPECLLLVSVPLPGFSGLRPIGLCDWSLRSSSFSPVAGIQWVETGS